MRAKRVLAAFGLRSALSRRRRWILAALAWRELNSTAAIGGRRRRGCESRAARRCAASPRDLAERGLLDKPWLLAAYARATGEATRIRAGEYQLAAGTTPLTLLEKLVAGEVYLHEITIVEGSRFAEVLAALRAHPADRRDRARRRGDHGRARRARRSSGRTVLPRHLSVPVRHHRCRAAAHRARSARARLRPRGGIASPDMLLKNDYEALILASIIEKETALATERRLIAGVFHERLRRNMRLQTDPTVIYGLGDAFDGNLRRQDLERDTPYNTYTRAGLPPTPIALPGAGALEAAVAPEIERRAVFRCDGPRRRQPLFLRDARGARRARCATISANCARASHNRARRVHFSGRYRGSRQVDEPRLHGRDRRAKRVSTSSRLASPAARASVSAFASGS